MARTKTCKSCNQTFPLNKTYFPQDRNRYRPVCRECFNRKQLGFHDAQCNTVEKMMRLRYDSARRRARRKGMEFNLTPEFLVELWRLQDGKCFYSGLPMSIERNDLYTVSIDRVDSNGGYTKDNVVLSCWSVNNMKNNRSTDQFIYLCHCVVSNYVVIPSV